MDWRDAEREYTDEVIGETTLPRAFLDAAERYGGDACQLYKGGTHDRSLVAGGIVPEATAGEYAALTYGDAAGIVRTLAAGFRELGVDPDDRIGIYADTRMEWAQADMALLSAGAVVTTVYTESSPPQVRYLLSDPGASGVVVGTAGLLETLLPVEDDLDLEFVVVMDDVDHGREDVYTLAEVHELGAEHGGDVESWIDERDLGDLASLVYTSGTTGDPKGVELTHGNWRASLNMIRKRLGPRPDKPEGTPVVDHDTVGLSFLPLAHAFERMNHFAMLASGATVAYAGSPDTVAEDIQEVRPDAAAAVPRVYERIYRGMREEAAGSGLTERIFEWAVATGRAYDEADDPGPLLEARRAIADRLVFSSVREALGGNVELFISGGGSLSADLGKLYRAMGITIVEGYGLTETAPVLTLTPPEDVRVGTVGPPLPGVDVKLDPTAASADTREDEDGEVGELLAKGPNVFSGYWESPDETEAAFDGEGWFRTGDIVAREGDGYFRFVDRVKNLIVLDTGKNVAPERIEDAFATAERVEQVMVTGQDEKFVGAVIVPNFEAVRDWARTEGIDLPEDPDALCADERVVGWVGAEVERVNEGLGHHESIKEFRLVPEEWTPDNDMLTPSMKKKRRNIREAYEGKIADIYGRGEEREARA